MPYIVLDRTTAEAAPATSIGAPYTSVGETLLSLRTELKKMLGNRADIDNARLNLWVNFGYVDVAASLKIDELRGSIGFPTVPGQPLYLLPNAVAAIYGAAVADSVNYPEFGGRALDKIDLAGYRSLKVITDEPERFFRLGDLLVLWPTPVAARDLALDFWIRPQPLVVDTDSPILGYEWHESILLNARKKAFSALQEFDKALAAQNDMVASVRTKQDNKAREDENRIVLSSVPRNKMMMQRNLKLTDGENDGIR